MLPLLSRTALKRLQSVPKFVRRYGHGGTEAELDATAEKWKKITLFICVPSIIACAIHCYIAETEHMSHPRPEFKKCDYMYIRTKPFPWGDGNHSLFHHPIYNALPEGYENPGWLIKAIKWLPFLKN